jgi:hypothetical protein
VVIVSELVGNAVEHGGSPGCGWRSPAAAAGCASRCAITAAASPTPVRLAERGRGLPIVRALARATTLHTGPSGWTVTVVLDLRA